MSDDAFYSLVFLAVVALYTLFVIRQWRKVEKETPPRTTPLQPFDYGESAGVLGAFFGGLPGCVFFFVVGAVGLFVVVCLLVKRMWEVA